MKAKYNGIELEGTPEEVLTILNGLMVNPSITVNTTIHGPSLNDIASDLLQRNLEGLRERMKTYKV